LQSSNEENISTSEYSKSDFETLEEFMGFKGKALKDLDAAKSELEKRAAQIQELATKTSEQFGGCNQNQFRFERKDYIFTRSNFIAQ